MGIKAHGFLEIVMKNKKKTAGNNFKSTITIPKIVSRNYLAASILLSIAAGLIPIVFANNLPPTIPLFYGLAEGENQLAKPLFLSLPGGSALLIALINTFLSIVIANNFVKKALILSSFAVSLLSFITTVKILLLVGSF